MDPIENMLSRQTVGRLVEPVPGPDVLARAFEAALAAPDHKRMRPFRFLVIQGEARARFGELLAQSLKSRKPDADDMSLESERSKPLRSPMLIVVAATTKEQPGVPEVEQLLSAGAATQNLLLALQAQGFGSGWKTGSGAYCPIVKAGLGLSPQDHIVGFVYTGTPAMKPPAPKRPAQQEFVRDWTEPLAASA